MLDLRQSLQDALRKVENLRRQADHNRSTLGEANYQELCENLADTKAGIRRQLAKCHARADWEQEMLREYARLRGAA